MSRHSKNNTASCVFTYGERLKLKKQNEWGDISARLGRHLFCKNCVVENLFHQKAEIKKSLKEWEENNKNRLLAESNLSEKLSASKKQELMVTVEDKIAHFEKNVDENYSLSQDEIVKANLVEKMEKAKGRIPRKDKINLIENCFWIPEKTPESISDIVKKPFELLECPMKEKDHYVKLKELIPIKLKKNDNRDKFNCSICEKEFNFQKIITLKKCGDTMCKVKLKFKNQKCYDTVCKKESVCSVCNDKFSLSDVINLQESGTCYSQHNVVSSSMLNPYFKY